MFAGDGEITIGKWGAIGEELRVISSNHKTQFANMHFGLFDMLSLQRASDPSPVSVGHGCWIGDRVTLLPGCSIGDGTVIAAGAVVRSTIPAFTVAAGVPARVVRQRFPAETVLELQELGWWNWTANELIARRKFFELDLTTASVDAIRESLQ